MDLDKARAADHGDSNRGEPGHAGAPGRTEPQLAKQVSTIGVLGLALILALWSIPRAIQAGDATPYSVARDILAGLLR